MKIPPILNSQRKGVFYWLVLNGFLQAIITISFSMLVKFVFDNFIYNYNNTFTIWNVSLIFLSLIAVFAWLKYKERSDAEALGQLYIHQLRNRMFSRLCRTDLRQLDQYGRGDIILRFASDLTAIRQWISLGYARLLVAGVIIVFVIITLCFINFTLTIIIAIVMMFNVIASLYIGHRMEKEFREARRSRSYLTNNLTEKITSLFTVKVFGQRNREKSRINKQSKRVVDSMVARAKIIGINRAITEISLLLSTSAVLVFGTVLVKDTSTTAGSVVAAMVVVALLTQPLRNIGRIYEYWHACNIAREKLECFLNKVKPEGREIPEQIGGGLLKLNVLSDFNGKVQPDKIIPFGKKIVILGKNGTGKSSLLANIAGVMRPSNGGVFLDGINVLNLQEKYLRTMIGMASSSLPLIKGTILKNICYRLPSATKEEIKQVIKDCRLESFINQLKNGLDFKVSIDGNNLSDGQKQKIILARALIGTPKILLLDEADSFLDEEASKLVSSIVENYLGTVIMVTHNINQILLADEVWLMSNGAIKWSGKSSDFSMSLLDENN